MPKTDERRGQLRKVAGSCKQALIRKCLNGRTRRGSSVSPQSEYIALEAGTQGIEPSQYLKEKKITMIPIVAASELGRA